MAETKKKQNPIKTSNTEDVKSDFITVASHQLRTPISAIRWSLDTLLSGRTGNLSEKQKEMVVEAYQNNNFMVKVVNDLLRVSRIEEKGINLKPEFINLEIMVQKVVNKYKIFAKAANCEITLVVDKNLPKVYFDPFQLEPIISSLVDNAIRYSKAKGKIKISLKRLKNQVLFKIKDNGIGIPHNQQDLVFSKFFRGRNAMKAQTEGMGLDLHVAKELLEDGGGKISFVSEENKMTIFRIYLPITKLELKAPPPARIDNYEDVLKKEREFVSITVHELKAPLGITKWSLEMLNSQKPGKLNEEQLELINQIYRGNERLLVLVRDLLNLAKLQEGKFEVEPKPVQFEEVIKDVISGFQNEARRKKINLEWLKEKKLLPKVLADQSRVAQIATNLVSNAIKYTPNNGKVLIEIKKATGQELKKISDKSATANINYINNKKGYLVFSVRDTGIGISNEDQTKLFTRFFRSKKVLSTEAEGTGLGLYITKSIIDLHQGDIWFTSQINKGSTFYFSLPIA